MQTQSESEPIIVASNDCNDFNTCDEITFTNDATRADDDSAQYNINIYRFKFTEDFMQDLSKFAKIHQYDDRISFKEAWTLWTEEYSDIIKQEEDRLYILGYKGDDVLDKMFKSARYYFRKKVTVAKPALQIRKTYVSINKELLARMDSHIKSELMDKGCKPHTGFLNFCETNLDVLKDTVETLQKRGYETAHDIQCKIKKTYKNRYSTISTFGKSGAKNYF